MIIIETITLPVLEHLGEAVLDLVAENVTDLAMTHPSPSHPLFSVFRLVLLTEVRAYLARPVPSQMELVTAVEDGKLLGFVLCGLSPSRECGIYYTAVTRSRRNEGIMSLMVRDVVTRYSAISLSCDVQLVPRYERYGFEPRSLRKHQVVMAIGNPVEETPILDPNALQQQPPILQEQFAASERSSEHAVKTANKAMTKFLKTERKRKRSGICSNASKSRPRQAESKSDARSY